MNDAKAKLQALIREKRFDDAREFVKQVNSPKAESMLARIDQLEQQANQASKPQQTAKTSPVQSQKSKTADVPSRISPQVSKKPLPMTLEEERIAIPKGRPDKPQDILAYRYNEGSLSFRFKVSNTIMNIVLGTRAITLASNYRRLDRMNLYIMAMLVYLVLIAGLIVAFVLVIIGFQSDNNSMILVAAILTLPPMIYPYILAYVQEPLYEEWLENYHQQAQNLNE